MNENEQIGDFFKKILEMDFKIEIFTNLRRDVDERPLKMFFVAIRSNQLRDSPGLNFAILRSENVIDAIEAAFHKATKISKLYETN